MRKRERGRSGAKKGHDFFGNQYAKITKYARGKGKSLQRGARRAKAFGRTHKKKITAVGAIIGGLVAYRGYQGSSGSISRGQRSFSRKLDKDFGKVMDL